MIPLIYPTPPSLRDCESHLQKSYQEHQFCNFGPAVVEFQRQLKDTLGLPHPALTFCNATLALEIALMGLELPAQSEVLVPSFTFAATAQAVLRVGLVPVLVDSNPTTWHMDLGSAETKMTKRTSAIIVVHPFGYRTNLGPYANFASINKLRLIADSAAAFGADYIGDADWKYAPEIFSFHVTKTLGIGEGAAMAFHHSAYLKYCQRVSNFGLNEEAEVEFIGTNAKMSDLQAAMGLAALEKVGSKMCLRRIVAHKYREGFVGNPLVVPQVGPNMEPHHTFPFYPIRYLGSMETMLGKLLDAKVGHRRYYKPLHLHPFFRQTDGTLPYADQLAQSVICLPCYEQLKDDQIGFIVELFK